ncbi:hypothetical protein K437DRAFT_249432 [Tilletiaria anomala UBC 951]|uniref:CDP-alcohol phosphatidyltransferase n=1 Tax=Tilletiaria anomala (strain ATCC 24038 / CBS 436.72 / UBC 951) TaxID=1037660 RepID=A0A066VIW5_TILAU|nr:uncharacterized protein K437DRAFT_249432 [Tilletiaria anomala UBC 951]KDN41687.1 hypothetical protein K437DRAFT_249432 [Tilletiaria anomala UBC 951]
MVHTSSSLSIPLRSGVFINCNAGATSSAWRQSHRSKGPEGARSLVPALPLLCICSQRRGLATVRGCTREVRTSRPKGTKFPLNSLQSSNASSVLRQMKLTSSRPFANSSAASTASQPESNAPGPPTPQPPSQGRDQRPVTLESKPKGKVTQAIEQLKAASGTSAPVALSENIYTIPNLLTTLRLLSVPVLGHLVLTSQMPAAAALLFVSGLTDVVDGWLARKCNSYTVFGSIADPAADKALMTVMVVCLAIKGLLPVPLAVLILGRDVALVLSAFLIRYRSLPPPKTFARYWDISLPSASVQPTQISKYNTFLQLLLVGATTLLPCLPPDVQALQSVQLGLSAFQIVVAATTVWSGANYLFGSGAVKYLHRK